MDAAAFGGEVVGCGIAGRGHYAGLTHVEATERGGQRREGGLAVEKPHARCNCLCFYVLCEIQMGEPTHFLFFSFLFFIGDPGFRPHYCRKRAVPEAGAFLRDMYN